MSKSVQIIEVGPRDGLQNEKKVLSVSDKTEFIERLLLAGLNNIEVTSFVNPKKIPQMGDATELFSSVKMLSNLVLETSSCLVPNLKGLEDAIDVGVKSVAIFTAVSDTFNMKNINATVEESFARLTPVAKMANEQGIKLRGYISTAFGCPYEGDVEISKVESVAQRLKDLGCYEVSIGDTIGIANPIQVKNVIAQLSKNFDKSFFSMHFHDTRGVALANIFSSFEEGMTKFDSSAGSLGGCPYAPGSIGNVATEDVVNMFESMGVHTGVELSKLIEATAFIFDKLKRACPSKYFNSCIK